jgi:hypothetical protein
MADEHTEQTTDSHETPGYERRDVSVPKAVVVGLLLVIVIVGFLVVLNEYFISVSEDIVYEQQLAPQSRELRELHAREAELLHSYDVIDSAAGTYRIPIERAMELNAEEAFQQRRK